MGKQKMSETQGNFFYGIMVMKEGKWTPHSKFDENSFGSALIKAEEIGADRTCEGVKVMRIPAAGSEVKPKEMWISPHLEARQAAEAAAKVREGEKKTKETMQQIHEQRKAQVRDS